MFRLTIVSVAFVSLISVAACQSSSAPAAETTLSSAAALRTYANVVGNWRFVYTGPRRAAVEAELAKKVSDPKALAEAKKEAAEEAAASEIEFTADHTFLSRIAGKGILRDSLTIKEGADVRTLDVSSSTGPNLFSVVLRDANTLVITDPKKGELVFTRAR